jgi:hypothetical protein
VRPALLWRQHRVPAGTALASVAFERVLDITVLSLFSLAFVALDPSAVSPALARTVVVSAAAIVALGATLVTLHRWRRASLERLLRHLARRLPARLARPAERLALTFVAGFDALGRPGAWWRLPLLSLLTWTPVLVGLHLVLIATGLDVPWSATLLVVPASALGIAVPTPAGVGSYHFAVTWALRDVLGQPAGAAAAAAVLAHAVAVVPVIVAGLYCLGREGLGLKSLRRVAAEANPAGSSP